MEAISSQQLIGRCNSINIIKTYRDNNTLRKNLQENIPMFNKIRHIQEIRNKMISITTNPPTPDKIGAIVKIFLRD